MGRRCVVALGLDMNRVIGTSLLLMLAVCGLTGLRGAGVSELESELQSLAELSVDTASGEAEPVADSRGIARRFCFLTEQARTYVTQLLIKDRTIKELESNQYVLILWDLQFVRPDQSFVRQKMWLQGRYVYDRWTILGSEYTDDFFQTKLPLEGRTHFDSIVRSRDAITRSLRVGKYLKILSDENPVSAALHRWRDRRYYLFGYDLGQLEGLDDLGVVVKGRIECRIWIDAAVGQVARADLVVPMRSEKGETIRREFQQLYVGYNSPLQIPKLGPLTKSKD